MPTEALTKASAATGWPDGTGMIYLAMSPWDEMWKNRHQLMSRFAREMPVLYVEPWARFRRLRRRIMAEGIGFRRAERPAVERISDRLFVFHSPATRAVSGSGLLAGITRRRWLTAVRKAARSVGISRPVLWISLPEMRFAAGEFNESLSIYHIVDEYGGYTGKDDSRREMLWTEEQRLLDEVDLTIVVSPELARAKAGAGRSIEMIENAVDFQAFRQALQDPQVPSEYERIPRPRLGYSGLIGKRLDLGLLLSIARRHPAWSIVLVGRVDDRGCESEISSLKAQPNVYFLGQQHVSAVPHYIAGFDVGLLPYELNLETRNISPLKLFEYIAAGKPVVATAIPAAARHETVVSVGKTHEQFIEICDRLIRQPVEKSGSELLMRYAAANTWDHRVQEVSDLLMQRLREEAR